MLIQKKYFKWDDSKSELPIKLRQPKQDLLNANLIAEIHNKERTEYTGINGFPYRVVFKEDLVNQLWFDHQNEFWHRGINLKEKVMNEGATYLYGCFEEIIEGGGDIQDSDRLYVALSNGFVRTLALIANSKEGGIKPASVFA